VLAWSVWALSLAVPLLESVGSVAVGEEAGSAPRKFALLAGVNRYDHRGLSEFPLEFAERDVTRLGELLQRLGYEVRILTGSGTGESRATKAQFDTALQATLRSARHEDIVLLGLAGHGLQLPLREPDGTVQTDVRGRPLEDACFCPVDAILDDPQTMVSLTQLLESSRYRGGINLILVDACRNDPTGSVGSGGRGAGGRARAFNGNELNGRLPGNTAVLFSCAAGQVALETKSAGGGHGVFFYHVISALEGEASDSRGEVSWNSLVEHVFRHTNRRANEWFPALHAERLQTPHEIRNLSQFPVLARMEPVQPPRIAVPPLPAVIRTPEAPAPAPATRPAVSPHTDEPHGPRPGELRADNGPKLPLVWCPPGSAFPGFWLGQTEVTQRQWTTVMGTTPWRGRRQGTRTVHREGPAYPAVYIDWVNADLFCQRLTLDERAAGRLGDSERYALPSEEQWMHACNAGGSSNFGFGSDARLLSQYAWFRGNTVDAGRLHAQEVAGLRPNVWGLYDMHGNVAEWCSNGQFTKGGDWTETEVRLWTIARFEFERRKTSGPQAQSAGLGFRVALVSSATQGQGDPDAPSPSPSPSPSAINPGNLPLRSPGGP
jgi:hypothetical protein